MKYKNRKIEYAGMVFDSKKERDRYVYLKAREDAGEITDLRRQVPYTLIPTLKVNGKVVERSIGYTADFVYEEDGETVVEDVKSEYTRKLRDYVIKRKLMLYVHGIQIREVL